MLKDHTQVTRAIKEDLRPQTEVKVVMEERSSLSLFLCRPPGVTQAPVKTCCCNKHLCTEFTWVTTWKHPQTAPTGSHTHLHTRTAGCTYTGDVSVQGVGVIDWDWWGHQLGRGLPQAERERYTERERQTDGALSGSVCSRLGSFWSKFESRFSSRESDRYQSTLFTPSGLKLIMSHRITLSLNNTPDGDKEIIYSACLILTQHSLSLSCFKDNMEITWRF